MWPTSAWEPGISHLFLGESLADITAVTFDHMMLHHWTTINSPVKASLRHRSHISCVNPSSDGLLWTGHHYRVATVKPASNSPDYSRYFKLHLRSVIKTRWNTKAESTEWTRWCHEQFFLSFIVYLAHLQPSLSLYLCLSRVCLTTAV